MSIKTKIIQKIVNIDIKIKSNYESKCYSAVNTNLIFG